MSVVYVDFMQSAQNIGQLLQMRAQSNPDHIAVRYLQEGVAGASSIDYLTLHRRAKAIATHLQQVVSAGARAIVMYHNDIDYICALFACFYAGITAVPVPPVKSRKEVKRLKNIIAQSDARLLLTNESGMSLLGESFWRSVGAKNIWPVVSSFTRFTAPTHGYHDRGIDADAIAMIDYWLADDTLETLIPHPVSHRELLQQALRPASDFGAIVGMPFHEKDSIIGLIAPSIHQCTITELKMAR